MKTEKKNQIVLWIAFLILCTSAFYVCYSRLNTKFLIYGKYYCPYTQGAIKFLRDAGIDFDYIEGTVEKEKLENIQQKMDYWTVPLIFKGRKFIGGKKEILEYKF